MYTLNTICYQGALDLALVDECVFMLFLEKCPYKQFPPWWCQAGPYLKKKLSETYTNPEGVYLAKK